MYRTSPREHGNGIIHLKAISGTWHEDLGKVLIIKAGASTSGEYIDETRPHPIRVRFAFDL